MLDFNAGKYAVFVWPAYALTVIVITALVVDTLARARRWRRAVEQAERTAALEASPDRK
ncbi:MAG TPA: heme exporter protein CcmD [Caulobacteraceae bacterium]|jgi:heme exporter protein D|nr:heme exporter protein CcmD [Caulobacteraceae bacterium]